MNISSLNNFLDRYEAGRCFDAWKFFGAHPDKRGGYSFRLYAPGAKMVYFCGTPNQYGETPMTHLGRGVFTIWMPYAMAGHVYKYIIIGKRGGRSEHCDPYGFGQTLDGYHNSVIRRVDPNRGLIKNGFSGRIAYDKPLHIYEMHLGSWKVKEGNRFSRYSYDEIAGDLVSYLKKNHYTHVEFLPLSEHPMDESLGYQITGFYAPTCRFGDLSLLQTLVGELHKNKIGVIFDFVSVHFANDHYGLKNFTGSALYEYKLPHKQRSEWGSFYFDHSKGHVRSFLNSLASFYIEILHADGLRFDAVSHLLYYDGKSEKGENKEGREFLKNINEGLSYAYPKVLLMAEDSTACPNITLPVNKGGFGFHYKWALGWTYDTLTFFTEAMEHKKYFSHKLSFYLDYFTSEHYILPFCHDEVSFGKKSLLSRMPGKEVDKRRLCKLFLTFMMTLPGGKLTFMGTELPMKSGWDVRRELPWQLLREWNGKSFHRFTEDLYRLYPLCPALYEADGEKWSADWLVNGERQEGIYALIRHAADDHILLIMNFSEKDQLAEIPLGNVSKTELLLSTEWHAYGGSLTDDSGYAAYSYGRVEMKMPALSAALIRVRF